MCWWDYNYEMNPSSVRVLLLTMYFYYFRTKFVHLAANQDEIEKNIKLLAIVLFQSNKCEKMKNHLEQFYNLSKTMFDQWNYEKTAWVSFLLGTQHFRNFIHRFQFSIDFIRLSYLLHFSLRQPKLICKNNNNYYY